MACRHLFWASAPEGVIPDEIVRSYLSETLRMIESCDLFEVLAHIDYPVRGWPAAAGMFDPADFEDEYRAVLHALASSGRALEVNTRLPMPAEIVGWWYAVGGEAVSFGSDAHEPSLGRAWLHGRRGDGRSARLPPGPGPPRLLAPTTIGSALPAVRSPHDSAT